MADEILIPNNQKIYSTGELRSLGLTQYKIRNLTHNGRLIRLNKSYYENSEYEGAESDFYYLKAYAPNGVVCLLSAAVYYGLSTYIPSAVDVAIPRNGKLSKNPEWPTFNVHYFTNDRYSLGIVEQTEGKNSFRIYDIEKTVVDIVYYREQAGIEETKEILKQYLARRDRNFNRLLNYADRTKCGKTLRQYLEVLV